VCYYESSVSRVLVGVFGIATGSASQHVDVDEMAKPTENVF